MTAIVKSIGYLSASLIIFSINMSSLKNSQGNFLFVLSVHVLFIKYEKEQTACLVSLIHFKKYAYGKCKQEGLDTN